MEKTNFRKYLRDKINMKTRVTDFEFDELQKIAIEEGVFWKGVGKKHMRSPASRVAIFFDSENGEYLMSWCFWDCEGWDYSMHRKYNPKTDTLGDEDAACKKLKDSFAEKKLSISVDLASGESKTTKEPKPVEEPKPVKTVGIDNDDVTLAKPTVKESLSVEPCKHLINGDACGNPFDHCDKDCPANSEYPDPIRLDIPDIFYCPTPQGILRFKRSQIILKDTNNDDCLLKLHDEYPCYRTIEEAVIVAKRLWSIK